MSRPLLGAVGGAGALALATEENRTAAVQLANNVVRAARVVGACAVIATDYRYTFLAHPDRKTEEGQAARVAAHGRCADRLAPLFKSLGGVYVKAGQYLASLNHMLPAEFTDPFRPLQDSAASLPLEDVRRTLEDELGAPLEVFFAKFGERAIAAASLAQVHHAVTHDGQEVAVKVQYPHLRRQVAGDVATIRFIFWAIPLVFPSFDYSWMLPDFRRVLAEEMNFLLEAQHTDQAAAAFRSDPRIHIPAVRWDLTSKRVMVGEFIHGCKIGDRPGLAAIGASPPEVGRVVSRAFGDMACSYGFVHSDPHPGNMLIRRTPRGASPALWQLVVLDHGMYRQLTPEFRRTYCKLWRAMVARDRARLEEAAAELNMPQLGDVFSLLFTYNTSGAASGVGQRMSREEGRKFRKRFEGTTSDDVIRFLRQVPRDLLYTMRCNDLVRSVNLELSGSSRGRFLETAKSAVRGWYDITPPEPLSVQATAATARIIADLRRDAGEIEDPQRRSASSHDAGFSIAHHPDDCDFRTSPWLLRRAQYGWDVAQLEWTVRAMEWLAWWRRLGVDPAATAPAHGHARAEWG